MNFKESYSSFFFSIFLKENPVDLKSYFILGFRGKSYFPLGSRGKSSNITKIIIHKGDPIKHINIQVNGFLFLDIAILYVKTKQNIPTTTTKNIYIS